MGQKSSILQIDAAVKAQLDQMIREGRATIDQMTAYLNEQLGEDAPSRSAIGRYKVSMEESMKVFQATQGMAQVWAKKLEEEPGSPVAQLAQQVLGSVALHTANAALNSGEAVPAGDLMFLCKALDHLSRAEKSTADRILKVRKEALQEAVAAVEEVAKSRGISAETRDEIRRRVMGI